MNKISTTIVFQGASLQEITRQMCGQFSQVFRYVLRTEIRKYQRRGLKSITVTNISVDKKENLVVEFDMLVNPRYNALIRDALRRVLVTLDVSYFCLVR